MNRNTWALMIVTLLLASCSSEDNKSVVAKQKNELAVFNEQVNALEKAKGVESMLQAAGEARRKEVEKVTQ